MKSQWLLALWGVLSLLASAGTACSGDLQPFISDGCSLFPEGTPAQQELWLDCCTAHDLAYWRGGTEEERLAADLELQRCVAAVGQPEVARLMLEGVRVGGTPRLPTRFRWGYGWPWPREYRPLTPGEQAEVTRLLDARKPPLPGRSAPK